MKNSLVVIIIIVAAILGFIVGYSLAPRTDVASSSVQETAPAPASGGYGSSAGHEVAPASGGYGSATAPAAGGYGAAPASGGHKAPAGGYGK
jgi:hypothetical protein